MSGWSAPAGNREGGQWTSGDAGGDARQQSAAGRRAGVGVQPFLEKAKQLAASGESAYQRCSDLCYPLLERFQLPGSDRNTFDFFKGLNACLGKNQ